MLQNNLHVFVARFSVTLRLLSRVKTLVSREKRQNCSLHARSTQIMMSFSLCSFTVVILLLADHPSKELLTEYTVPLAYLKPFHQYHLELVQVSTFITYSSARDIPRGLIV